MGNRSVKDGRISLRFCQSAWIGLATIALAAPAAAAQVPWREVARWKRDSVPTMVAISRDGEIVAANEGDAGRIVLWDRSKRGVVQSCVHEEADTLQFSPDGKLLATTDGRPSRWSRAGPGIVRLWSVATGAMLHEISSDWGVSAAAFTPDGKKIVVALHNSVAVLDVRTGEQLAATSARDNPTSSNIRSVLVANSGDEVFSVDGDDIDIWTQDSLKRKRVMYSGRLRSVVAVAPNAKQYATCTAINGEAQAVTVIETWDLIKNRRYNRSEVPGWHRNITYSPDGAFLLAVGDSRQVHLWNAHTLEYRGKIEDACGPAGFSGDGSFVAAATTSGDIGVWDLRAKAGE